MKFWVVGSQGLLGQEMCAHLGEKGVGSSRTEADILNPEALARFYEVHRPTHIVNCVAYTDVDKAEKDPLAYALNVTGVQNLVDLAAMHRVHLIHISTDYVFDGKKRMPYEESDVTHPINAYGHTKRMGEEIVLQYEKGLSVRTASLYGVYKKGLISGMIEALQTRDEVQHVTDQISSPTWTKDLASGIYQLRDATGVAHFVNRGEVSRYGLLVHLAHLIKSKARIKAVTQKEIQRPAARPVYSVLAMRHEVRTWEEALEEYAV